MSDRSDRCGDWCQTFTGRQFWPLDPRAEDLDVRDIAHALACQNRFAGHARQPYSVGEHSLRVMYALDLEPSLGLRRGNELRLAALLHDATEAYLVDVPRPVKRSPELAGYREAEERLARVIEQWARLPAGILDAPEVKRADAVLLMTEARDLCAPPPEPWGFGRDIKPLPGRIEPWRWQTAEMEFLHEFSELSRELAGFGRG